MAARKAAPVANTGSGSPAYVRRVQGLRASGEAGAHLSRRDRRARTRAAARDRAVERGRAAG